MRIFLICLSLLYVLGVSYSQRLSMGSPLCAQSDLSFSFDTAQIGATLKR